MSSQRLSKNVVQELLEAMSRTVHDYHPEVTRTPVDVRELVDGTAMFPGGTGLWRGENSFGPLPTNFPEEPVMFVGHNLIALVRTRNVARMAASRDRNFGRF